MVLRLLLLFFFFNDPATTEIYTLSLHDALPIPVAVAEHRAVAVPERVGQVVAVVHDDPDPAAAPVERVARSEEHTSELQSQFHLVCRLLLEKKKKNKKTHDDTTQVITSAAGAPD